MDEGLTRHHWLSVSSCAKDGRTSGAGEPTGLGSTFWFELPLAVVEMEAGIEAIPTSTVTEDATEMDLSGRTALVVDDETVNRRLVGCLLEGLDCQVEPAVGGQQALDKFQAGRYDLILMDLQMPQVGGCESSRQMQQQKRSMGRSEGTPILAVTASAWGEVEEQCRQASIDGYIRIPFIPLFFPNLSFNLASTFLASLGPTKICAAKPAGVSISDLPCWSV